jgi:cytoskeletal protein CcmA (bactofilin family)
VLSENAQSLLRWDTRVPGCCVDATSGTAGGHGSVTKVRVRMIHGVGEVMFNTDLIFRAGIPIVVLGWERQPCGDIPAVTMTLDPKHLRKRDWLDAEFLYDLLVEDPRLMPPKNKNASTTWERDAAKSTQLKEEEDQMFGKAKHHLHEEDEHPLAPQLQNLTPASVVNSDSTKISCIGPGMTVVGKISNEGILNIFGRVEGELHASIVRVSDGAQVEGTIVAEELTIDGRFKGSIQANRVTLTSSAIVEGEIHHHCLAIEGNAWFAGVSRPKEALAREVAEPLSQIAHTPTD